MRKSKDKLTFVELRKANLKRCLKFKDKRGNLAHPEGIDNWSYNDWATALSGEVGETCNLLKKLNRGDFDFSEEFKQELANELADIAIYLDLLSARADVDLGKAIRDKFNEVSEKQNIKIKL